MLKNLQHIHFLTTNLNEIKTKYIMVPWPHSQKFIEHERSNECYLVKAIEKQEELPALYFVPEDYTMISSIKISNSTPNTP
jgi:hypothetical protein